MPNGHYKTTSEGIEFHFAVQVLGRFLLAYILASSGTLHNTSISVMGPGETQTEFNLDDIELLAGKESTRYVQMAKHVARDGIITDTYTNALQNKFPTIKFFHLSPGLVQTEVMNNQGVPFPFRQLVNNVVFPIAARTFGNTATSYAEIPVFLAGNEDRDTVVEKQGLFLDQKLHRVKMSPFVLDEKNQETVFEQLKGYMDGR
jgi:hypothetical protein